MKIKLCLVKNFTTSVSSYQDVTELSLTAPLVDFRTYPRHTDLHYTQASAVFIHTFYPHFSDGTSTDLHVRTSAFYQHPMPTNLYLVKDWGLGFELVSL